MSSSTLAEIHYWLSVKLKGPEHEAIQVLGYEADLRFGCMLHVDWRNVISQRGRSVCSYLTFDRLQPGRVESN